LIQIIKIDVILARDNYSGVELLSGGAMRIDEVKSDHTRGQYASLDELHTRYFLAAKAFLFVIAAIVLLVPVIGHSQAYPSRPDPADRAIHAAGFAVPAGISPNLIQRLNSEINKALASPTISKSVAWCDSTGGGGHAGGIRGTRPKGNRETG
jgi:hypothetical protein